MRLCLWAAAETRVIIKKKSSEQIAWVATHNMLRHETETRRHLLAG